MKISTEQRVALDLALNEATLNYVEIHPDSIEILLDCISKNEQNEFPDDNRHTLLFPNYSRIAVSFRKGEWNDENAKIVTIEPQSLRSQFEGLILDSMYGWEFINLQDDSFHDWSNKLSLDSINKSNWSEMNTIDLFAEQNGKDAITIDIRIWFEDFQIFDFNGRELSKLQFAKNGQRGWEQLYKTGISTENHKTRNY